MKLPLFIALRYLFSKRKKNFINIISIISIFVVAIITASLIIVLSVFNGLEDLLRTLNNSFDPPFKIVASKGKSFEISDDLIGKMRAISGVEIITEVIEDYAYVRYRDANQVITLKGVSDNFLDQQRIDNSIVQGSLKLKEGNTGYALVGMGIQYSLSIQVEENHHPLQVYYIKSGTGASLDPSRLYSARSILPIGVFSVQIPQIDDNYIIVPLEFAIDLFNYQNKRTSLEIKIHPSANDANVQKQLQTLLGESFEVLNHEQQHTDLYKLLKMEKLFAFIAFTLLLCIGSINIFFSLMMLALDKKKDVSILHALGAQLKTIRYVFLLEGAFVAILGTFLGLIIGASLCWLQAHFGMISMGMQSSVTEGYPVKMVLQDFLNVLFVMFFITFLISYRPATLATQFANVQNL